MYNYFNNNVTNLWNNENTSRKQSYSSVPPMDHGPNPFIVDIKKSTEHNHAYRSALWTGKHLQLTLMSIPVGGDIGLEVHPNVDQFLRIEEGHGLAKMGRETSLNDKEEQVFKILLRGINDESPERPKHALMSVEEALLCFDGTPYANFRNTFRIERIDNPETESYIGNQIVNKEAV